MVAVMGLWPPMRRSRVSDHVSLTSALMLNIRTRFLAASLAAAFATAALGMGGCLIPPGPQTTPASGVTGQPRASMTAALPKGENPFRDAYFAVDPESNARRLADQWRTSRPADAAAMDKIASQPSAAWFGNWNPN